MGSLSHTSMSRPESFALTRIPMMCSSPSFGIARVRIWISGGFHGACYQLGRDLSSGVCQKAKAPALGSELGEQSRESNGGVECYQREIVGRLPGARRWDHGIGGV